MLLPRFASFSIWTLTAFLLVGAALKYEPPQRQTLAPISSNQILSVDSQHIERLFQASAALSAAPQVASNSSLVLKGILYASNPSHSRALLQTKGAKVESFAIGRSLPNGAQLVAIDRRSVTYEMQGQRQQLSLPKQP